MILETFNKLAELESKDKYEIINGFLDKMLDDWSAVIDKTQIGQLNKLATLDDKKESMKNDIKTALGAWEQESHRIREEQKNRLISSSGPSQSHDSSTDSTVNSHSSLNFSLSYPSSAVSDQKKREGFQQSSNVRAAAAASFQRRSSSKALMSDVDKSQRTEDLQPRDLSQLQTPEKNQKKSPGGTLWSAAQASADRRRKEKEDKARKVENNQNKESETGPSNTSSSNSSNKKGTTP